MVAAFPPPRNTQLNGATPRMFGYRKEPYPHPKSEWVQLDDELGQSHRSAADLGHVPMSGPGGTLEAAHQARSRGFAAAPGDHGRGRRGGARRHAYPAVDTEGRPGAATTSPLSWRTTATSGAPPAGSPTRSTCRSSSPAAACTCGPASASAPGSRADPSI